MSMGQDELSNAPNFCKKSRRSYKKVLEITCRVITNCEKQINLYADPFGSELAKLARWVNEAMRKTHLVEASPCYLFYHLALLLGEHSEERMGTKSAGLCVLFRQMADRLFNAGRLEFSNFALALKDSICYLEELGWKDKLFVFGLKPYSETLSKLSQQGLTMSQCLEEAASAAEHSAKLTGHDITTGNQLAGVCDSGAHAVGVITRAIYQSINLSIHLP